MAWVYISIITSVFMISKQQKCQMQRWAAVDRLPTDSHWPKEIAWLCLISKGIKMCPSNKDLIDSNKMTMDSAKVCYELLTAVWSVSCSSNQTRPQLLSSPFYNLNTTWNNSIFHKHSIIWFHIVVFKFPGFKTKVIYPTNLFWSLQNILSALTVCLHRDFIYSFMIFFSFGDKIIFMLW